MVAVEDVWVNGCGSVLSEGVLNFRDKCEGKLWCDPFGTLLGSVEGVVVVRVFVVECESEGGFKFPVAYIGGVFFHSFSSLMLEVVAKGVVCLVDL